MFRSLFKDVKAAAAVAEPKEIPAEVIHAEVDAAEEVFLNQVKKFLEEKSTKKVAIADDELRKSQLLQELGFNNSKLIKEVNDKKEVNAKLEKEAQLLQESIDLFQRYKSNYPLEKIMPFEDFEKVLKKYNLITAPASSYIKDVPEKNLLEIKNAKRLDIRDAMPAIKYISQITGNFKTQEDLEKAAKLISNNKSLRFITNRYGAQQDENKESCYHKIRDLIKKEFNVYLLERNIFYRYISREGLFIAAPKNHFDLESLTKVTGFEYYAKQIEDVKVIMPTKDPIAFQFLSGNEKYPEGFVRILTKWGTDDDKSYLDPSIQHGLMN